MEMVPLDVANQIMILQKKPVKMLQGTRGWLNNASPDGARLAFRVTRANRPSRFLKPTSYTVNK